MGQPKIEIQSAASARIREARKRAGLKKWAAAAALGISADEYQMYESGRPMPIEHLLAFSSLVRCAPSYILSGRVVPAAHPVVNHGNLYTPQNPCGAPCPFGSFWCRESCRS